MTLWSETTTPVDAQIIDRLVEIWRPYDAGVPGMARMVDIPVDELRDAHRGGPPYRLKIPAFVLLTCYYHPPVREVMVPLLTPEAIMIADAFVVQIGRLQSVVDAGYDLADAATIQAAEAAVRNALPSTLQHLERP